MKTKILVVFLTIAIAGCSSQNASNNSGTAENKLVIVQHESFTPSTLTIKIGDMVTWKNINDFVGLAYQQHTVTSGTIVQTGGNPDGLVRAPLKKDEVFSYKFTEPGEYLFYLNEHPQYTGPMRIIVEG